MNKKLAAITMAAISMTGIGVMGSSGAAHADSRCSTSSHTHGALFWKRTDNFLSRWRYVDGYGNRRSSYHHTNSDPISGCPNY